MLLKQLELKFGPVPAATVERVRNADRGAGSLGRADHRATTLDGVFAD